MAWSIYLVYIQYIDKIVDDCDKDSLKNYKYGGEYKWQ